MRYRLYNAVMPTTASIVPVATGTNIKSLLQIKPFNLMKAIAWGISFDGVSGVPGIVEFLETGTVFATVTAHLDADILKMGSTDQAAASVAGLTLGAAATGYTATAEGSIVASRMLDGQQISPASQYIYQWPLGQEPSLYVGSCYRIRVKMPVGVNALCWVEVDI